MFAKNLAARFGDGFVNLADEIFWLPARGIRRSEKDAAWFQDFQRVSNEARVVVFGAEQPGLFGFGEGRRVEKNDIEGALFFGEAFKPIEDVAVNEIVFGGVEV